MWLRAGSGTRSECFSSRADAPCHLSARSEEMQQAAARRAAAIGPADSAEDAARLAGLIGAAVPGVEAWSAAWQAQARAWSAWWDPSAWTAGAQAAAALAPGFPADVLKRLRRASAGR